MPSSIAVHRTRKGLRVGAPVAVWRAARKLGVVIELPDDVRGAWLTATCPPAIAADVMAALTAALIEERDDA